MLKNLTNIVNIFNIIDAKIDIDNVNNFFVTNPENWQFGFQTPYSPVMEGIVSFHDDLVIFLTFIVVFVMYILYYIFSTFTIDASNSRAKVKTPEFGGFVHHPMLEIIWTIIPAVILVNLALPSFSLLYSVDEIVEPAFTFKAVGHQWYWSYEIMAGNEFAETVLGDTSYHVADTSFDSYMLADEDLNQNKKHHIRLLAVDNYVVLPTEQNVRVLVTAADVIHSWAIPSLGVKLDGCPGRLNQTSLFIERPGFYYGQCSELCGVNHGFMPIGILALDVWGSKLPASLAEGLFLNSVREESNNGARLCEASVKYGVADDYNFWDYIGWVFVLSILLPLYIKYRKKKETNERTIESNENSRSQDSSAD